MTRSQVTWLLLLILAVLSSGVGVVYAKNQSRALFVQLQKMREVADLEALEWGRLQLELASEGSLEDVMRIAGGRMRMRPPEAGNVVVVD